MCRIWLTRQTYVKPPLLSTLKHTILLEMIGLRIFTRPLGHISFLYRHLFSRKEDVLCAINDSNSLLLRTSSFIYFLILQGNKWTFCMLHCLEEGFPIGAYPHFWIVFNCVCSSHNYDCFSGIIRPKKCHLLLIDHIKKTRHVINFLKLIMWVQRNCIPLWSSTLNPLL